MSAGAAAHERLLACAGYAAFYAEAADNDESEMVELFADWLIYPGEPLGRFAKWTADDFRAKWDFWNS